MSALSSLASWLDTLRSPFPANTLGGTWGMLSHPSGWVVRKTPRRFRAGELASGVPGVARRWALQQAFQGLHHSHEDREECEHHAQEVEVHHLLHGSTSSPSSVSGRAGGLGKRWAGVNLQPWRRSAPGPGPPSQAGNVLPQQTLQTTRLQREAYGFNQHHSTP